jgi:Putative transposase/Transposase zinc-binding domain
MISAVHTRPSLEVGDIFRAHADAYRATHPLTPQQGQVLRRLAQCRTAALGGHVEACGGCGFTRISYNSCRDRHCPKCQASKRAAWLETRLERLLPISYFHVVFTLPAVLNPLVLHNQRLLYDLLLRAASATLLTLAADPQRLGAQIGVTAILHTWGQNLLFHPHVHCVVTGGGLALDGQRWVAGRRQYFLPVKVLGKLFRGKFLAGLKAAYQAGQLRLTGSVAALADPQAFQQLLEPLYGRNWIVYAKRPFGGPQQVFRYLGRYSHRVAIANARLVSMDHNQVSFQWKDYAAGQQTKVMTVAAEEFVRRFLLHVLPKGFVRIRHFGLLASVNVATKLARCRQLLGQEAQPAPRPQPLWSERVREWTGQDPRRCPQCQGLLERRPLAQSPPGACRQPEAVPAPVPPPHGKLVQADSS